MVFSFQQGEGNHTELSQFNRKTRVARALTAFMSYHSGYLDQYGVGVGEVDARAHEAIQTYTTVEDISDSRAESALSFNTQFSQTGIEAIRMDSHVLERAIHLPPVNSQQVINFPAPCSIQISEVPNVTITYDNYEAFHQAYRDLALCVRYYPEIVLDGIKYDMWRTFGPLINPDMAIRLEGEAFIPPEIRISGADESLSINEILCSQGHDGHLTTVVGQVLEMGDARKRAIRIAWKCQNPACGCLTPRIVDPFEYTESKPRECEYCGWGSADSTNKAEFIQDGAPNTTFITYQRLMLRQTDTQMTTPPQLLVEVRGTHVHSMNQGEDVAITGIFRTIEDKNGSKVERLPLLYGTDLTRTSQDSVVVVTDPEEAILRAWKEDEGFEKIMSYLTTATASHVIGHSVEKTALVIQSVGSYRNLPDGKRPFIHVLFIGDPGTAKTELLKFATSVPHPGSKIASGPRSSIRGLIGGKSENQRLLGSSQTTLSPGLLALIPEGAIAGIDELHALGDDKTFQYLNDALESGIVHVEMQMRGTIRTPTPVLGCANPRKGDNTKFDMDSGEAFLEQAGLPNNFTTRFDLIFPFFDRVDEDQDEAIFTGMVGSMNRSTQDPNESFPIPEGYRKYLQLARQVEAAEEVWSSASKNHAVKIGVRVRTQSKLAGASVSKRWMASLVRMSNAVARIDLSTVVEKRHIDFAYGILAESLTTKEPNMVNEGGNMLSAAQTVVYDELMRLLDDWDTYELLQTNFGLKDDAFDYVTKNWALDAGENPCPDKRTFDTMCDTLVKQNKVEKRGKMMGMKGK